MSDVATHGATPEVPSIDDLVERRQAAIACPYPAFAALRSDDPISFNDTLGAWIVTRYDDVTTILHDTERFSSLMPTGPQAVGGVLATAMAELAQDPEMAQTFEAVMGNRSRAAVLLNADPPEHRRQRILVNGAFRPSNIKDLEPRMVEVAHGLLDDIVGAAGERGAAEIVHRFCVLFPMTIIATALGVGDDDLARFKRWSDDVVMPVGNHSPSVEQVRGYLTSSREFADYFREKLAARRREPTGDVISDVANAELDGEQLSEAEMLSMLQQFLVAGNETTTNLLSNIVRHLAERPELQRRIRDDRSLIPGLVEEALRFEAPVGGLFRQAKVDVTVGGTQIRAGQHCWLLFASANRDEARFPDPDALDPCRANLRDHLAFGHGEHFCIGASLARAEGRIATNALLDRLGDITLAPDNTFPFNDTFVLRGMTELHIEFTSLPWKRDPEMSDPT
jgi:cytochrome P450